jgi:hypothetical protein
MIRSAVLSVIGIEAITQVDAGRVSIGTFSIAGTAFVVDALGVSRGAYIEHVLGKLGAHSRAQAVAAAYAAS